MKITLLGTSHGVPSETRFCSSYMIETRGNIYIFDGGAPVIDLLLRKNKDLTKVKAFFNSHFHSDHILGVLSMASLFEWYYTNTDIDMYFPEENSRKAFCDILKATGGLQLPTERVRMDIIKEGIVFDDGILKVTAIRVYHPCGENKKSYAFVIEAEGKTVLYTGDMSASLEDFPRVAYERFMNVIISECAHCPAAKLMECMDKVDTDIFVVSHLFPMDKISEFEENQDRYSFKVIIAEDDAEIEI